MSTTTSPAANSTATGAVWSRPPATACWPPSTDPPEPSAAPAPSATPSPPSAWSLAPPSTPARSTCAATTWAASPSTSASASPPWPTPDRSSSPGPSTTSSSDRASNSNTAGPRPSEACPVHGRSSPCRAADHPANDSEQPPAPDAAPPSRDPRHRPGRDLTHNQLPGPSSAEQRSRCSFRRLGRQGDPKWSAHLGEGPLTRVPLRSYATAVLRNTLGHGRSPHPPPD